MCQPPGVKVKITWTYSKTCNEETVMMAIRLGRHVKESGRIERCNEQDYVLQYGIYNLIGPLTGGRGGGGGVLMVHVDSKKCQCRMSLSLDISPAPC